MQPMATQAREPDPETAEKATRRHFTAAYKRKILAQTEHAGEGQIGAILRREGLYSSLLSTWRRQRDEGTLGALKAKKRGPKPKKDPEQKEMERLRRRVAQLEHKLETAELIIDVQKKVSQLLGIPLATIEPSEKS
jgi:transposase